MEVFHRDDVGGNPNESAVDLRESWIGLATFEVKQLQVPPAQGSKAAGYGVRRVPAKVAAQGLQDQPSEDVHESRGERVESADTKPADHLVQCRLRD